MLTILRALESPVIEALGWSLVHFVWQAALVAGLLAGLLVPLRRVSARVRYLVQCAALVAMAACPPATWWWIASSEGANDVAVVSRDDRAAANEAVRSQDRPVLGPMVASSFETAEPILVAPAPVANDRERSPFSSQPDRMEQPPADQILSWNERVHRGVAPALPWLVGTWLLGVVALSLRLLVGWRIVQRLKRLAVTPAAAAWQLRLKDLAARLRISRPVTLVESGLIEVPTVIGWLRPAVLLPMSLLTNLTPQQLEAVLAHELAHIRRHDYLANLIQTAIETLLFYHPAVWWLSRLIRNEREHCCDDLALSLCDSPVTYVSALAVMEELRASPALTLAANGGSLLCRIRRIALGPATDSRRSIWWGASLIALTTLFALGLTTYIATHANDDAQSMTNKLPNATIDVSEAAMSDETADPIVNVFQEFTPDSLPVQDVSHIKDPDELLDQLEKGPRVSHFLMTGGGIFWQPGTAPPSWQVELWNRRFAGDKELDPRVRQLIKLGGAARSKVQRRSAAAKPQVQSHLALVLRSTGTAESIPVLIQSLHDLNKPEQPAMDSPSAMSAIAVTSAVWELTGRKHLFTPQEWDQWWNGVKADFVVSRDRQHPEQVALVTSARVQALVIQLTKQEEVARERLIALGPAAVPHLLESLKDALRNKPADATAQPGAARTMSHRLAWVIDELGATSRLPGLLRRDYFRRRFSDGGTHAGIYPIDEDALSRALSHCSFADYCSIFLEADSQDIVQQHGKWPFEIYAAYCRRFSKISPPNLGGWSENEHWKKVVPAEDPADEIAGAVPVLVAALKDDLAQKRNAACRLAAAIGFCSSAKPETLIVALRDAWLAEADEKVRPEIAFAMCRFQTPFVVKEISNGMLSDRPEIVSDCAGLMDWIPIQFNDETRAAFERLVELTRHDNDKLRNRAVRSLRGKAVKLLVPELLRLSQDKVVDIRKECAHALRDNPDPKFADILFQLADDADEQVRIDAIDSIGNLKHPESMSRLVPLLRDKRIHGSAVSALASMGGKDALPLMMDELKAGNDVGGMIYQHLRRLTDEKFEDKPELWLDWWKRQPNSMPFGLGFLKSYPKLHGLSLDMTEPQFLEIVKQQELKTRKTVEGEKVTHHIALGDDHTLVVMFDKAAKCSGIQRVRGADEQNSGGTPELRVMKKPAVLLPDHWIVQAVGFDGDGKELVTASNQSFITVRRWDLAGMKLLSEIKLQGDKHGRQTLPITLKFSGDRRRVIAATDAYVGIWDAVTGKLLKQLPFEAKNGIYDCAIDQLDCTPDFSVIVGHRALPGRLTLSYDAHVIVWDGVSGNVLQTVIDKGATDLKAIDLSTDGKRLVTTNGGGAKIWETSTGQLLRSIPNDNSGRKHSEPDVSSQYTSHVWSVQFSPDGKQLAMGDILGVKLLDATSGKLLQQLEGPYRYSSSGSPGLVFSKDGQWLARLGTQEKAEGDKHRYVVPIWSTRTGARLFELHTEANDAAFSDDGQRLAVVFSDMQQALSVWMLSGDAANVEQTAGLGPHSRQDRVEENGHYVGKTAAEFIDKFQPTWGDTQLGLQYGIALTKPQRQFRSGERVLLVVFFRNASDKPIKFDTAPDFFGNTPKVLNAKGEPIALENIPLLGHIPHYHEQLAPGEALGPFYLNFGLGENPRPGQQHWHPYFKTPVAGQYKLTHSVSINVAGQKDGDESKRDTITSSTIEFEITDGDKAAARDQADKSGAATLEKPAEPINKLRHAVESLDPRQGIALVGSIDFDGDGISDREQLHKQFKASGVVIDEEIGDDGHPLIKAGRISESTKYLAIGEIDSIRDPKLRDRTIEHLNRMRTDARANGVRVIYLRDFFAYGSRSRFGQNRQSGTLSGKGYQLGIDKPAVNSPLGGGGERFRPKRPAAGTTSKLFGERE